MKMKKMAAIGASVMLALSARADDIKLNIGYTDITLAASTQGATARTLMNADVDLKDFNVSYRAMHQVENFNADTYFGLNRIGLGLKDTKTIVQPTVRLLTSKQGIFDKKIGFESNIPATKLGALYGWAGLYSDGKNHTADMLLGHSLSTLGKATGMKFLDNMVVENVVSYDIGKPKSLFWEGQLNKPVGKKSFLFIRGDSNKNVYGGIGVKF